MELTIVCHMIQRATYCFPSIALDSPVGRIVINPFCLWVLCRLFLSYTIYLPLIIDQPPFTLHLKVTSWNALPDSFLLSILMYIFIMAPSFCSMRVLLLELDSFLCP